MNGFKNAVGLKSLASDSSEDLLKNVEVFGHEVQYKNMVTQAFPNHPQAAKLLDHEVLTEGVLSGF
jgi:hypothetical protein